MNETDIRQVDPMVQKLVTYVHRIGWDHPETLALSAQLTERLKRPSREEAQAFLSRFGLPYDKDTKILDYFCGPEPKPKSVVTVGELYGACQAGNHDTCVGMMLFSCSHQVAKGGYCTCDCHKPD